MLADRVTFYWFACSNMGNWLQPLPLKSKLKKTKLNYIYIYRYIYRYRYIYIKYISNINNIYNKHIYFPKLLSLILISKKQLETQNNLHANLCFVQCQCSHAF